MASNHALQVLCWILRNPSAHHDHGLLAAHLRPGNMHHPCALDRRGGPQIEPIPLGFFQRTKQHASMMCAQCALDFCRGEPWPQFCFDYWRLFCTCRRIPVCFIEIRAGTPGLGVQMLEALCGVLSAVRSERYGALGQVRESFAQGLRSCKCVFSGQGKTGRMTLWDEAGRAQRND